MTDLFDERAMGAVPSKAAPSACCQSSGGNASSCCNPKDGSWSKGKMLISAIIMLAAFGVGASSFVRVTTAQSEKISPARSFAAALDEHPASPEVDLDKVKPRPQREEILFEILSSLQTLDTLAADKDVVFIIMLDQGQQSSRTNCKQIALVLNKLRASGQKIAAFTLGNTGPDYDRLVQHFAVKSFPCVVVIGRQGIASAVSGDITETRLYNAFVQAFKPTACCPTSSTAGCCPK